MSTLPKRLIHFLICFCRFVHSNYLFQFAFSLYGSVEAYKLRKYSVLSLKCTVWTNCPIDLNIFWSLKHFFNRIGQIVFRQHTISAILQLGSNSLFLLGSNSFCQLFKNQIFMILDVYFVVLETIFGILSTKRSNRAIGHFVC